MGKSTISIAIFNSYANVYQKVTQNGQFQIHQITSHGLGAHIPRKVSRPQEHEIFVLADRWEWRHAFRAPTKGPKFLAEEWFVNGKNHRMAMDGGFL